jgi:hypothetical protein
MIANAASAIKFFSAGRSNDKHDSDDDSIKELIKKLDRSKSQRIDSQEKKEDNRENSEEQQNFQEEDQIIYSKMDRIDLRKSRDSVMFNATMAQIYGFERRDKEDLHASKLEQVRK